MIESYSFGEIKIDGKKFTSDLIIYPQRIDSHWWRKEGHALNIEDITDIIEASPDTLILGTGMSGLLKILPETKRFIESKGIKLISKKTEKACRLFNELCDKEKVVAALHLTC